MPQRIALLSIHTSPLDQPGSGDAGGLNVYVTETARRLAERGVEVDIFTRATSSLLPPRVELFPRVNVRHLIAGPFEGLRKEDLPAQLCALSTHLMRAGVERPYDVVHSHYWLSGHCGWLLKERFDIPLVHSMHTMAKVKNLEHAETDLKEPPARIIGEEQVVAAADMLVANTETEAQQLRDLYGARPDQLQVVHPGVDLDVFTPGNPRRARADLDIADSDVVLLFVGRLQSLKGPDLAVRSAAALLQQRPELSPHLRLIVVGGPSGQDSITPDALRKLATQHGIAQRLTLVPPQSRASLAQYYRAADVTLVPSFSESFGLVAVESQASGTPVVAAHVGGLPTAVRHGESGILVNEPNPHRYAEALWQVLSSPHQQAVLSANAVRHADAFSWQHSTDELLQIYRKVSSPHVEDLPRNLGPGTVTEFPLRVADSGA